ncbi:MAG: hypothetical protein H6R18_433 [Proteobacteria bacterium]|nr:hypothetical protein [Pseudomonadota bacterium]
MSVDRQVSLNLSIPNPNAQNLRNDIGGQNTDGRDAPDAETQERFAMAMANEKVAPQQTVANPMPPPFSLYQTAVSPNLASYSEKSAGQAELASSLSEEVDRLMVADGSNGNRQVRMDLKDDLLPGVTVTIQENEGRLQVDFICSIESSRLKLSRALPELANTLAQRLQRDVLMRVQTDDDEDPCLQEVLASF